MLLAEAASVLQGSEAFYLRQTGSAYLEKLVGKQRLEMMIQNP